MLFHGEYHSPSAGLHNKRMVSIALIMKVKGSAFLFTVCIKKSGIQIQNDSLWHLNTVNSFSKYSAIEYRIEDEQQSKDALEALAKALNGQECQVQETTLLKTTAISDHLPDEYNISGEEIRTPGFECMSLTDYNTLLNSQGKESTISELRDTECVLVKYRPDPENKDVGAVYRLNFGKGSTSLRLPAVTFRSSARLRSKSTASISRRTLRSSAVSSRSTSVSRRLPRPLRF